MKKLILFFTLVYAPFLSQSQSLDVFIEGGVDDAEELLKNYFEPAFLGFGYGLTNNWANTAKPHQPLGFDVTLSLSVAYVPEKATFFTFNPNDYSNVTLADPSKDQLPTIFGPNLDADDIPEIVFNEGQQESEVTFSSPTGLGMEEVIGFNAVPAPMIQAGLGLIKETDLKIRTIPTYTYKNGDTEVKLGMLGFGILHDMKQHVPAFAFAPFELSLLAGFSRISVETTPDINTPGNVTRLSVKGATLQVLGSKDFVKIITLYGGVGLNGAFTRVRLDGSYEIESSLQPLVDPIDFKFSNFSPRATVGVKLNLAIITINADYTVQKYNTLSMGVGVSVR
ncbi:MULTISPECIES: DUF6588 family protein [unclassified Imperialibacter]|uniref:DUF6588 family protein n=1 Tax=unclassified Imperialibacter TaxID=2629706 RepID=UPI001252D62A|nr:MULTISPECIES: DUF6588 family protein [unclassified Imperialibacter]CAD5256899.1 conserved hypothetical protein [Imperialibacter sp. 89]CAD5271904.1 conserved hypothetical protein [Imperialibacter sp. 75]VVT18975.1 conserved hypothetical protein [Imperialibacter sp. EC-SDR9]